MVICVALLLVTFAAAHAGTWQGTRATRDGVLHIENPAQGMESPRTIRLKEEWRIGGEESEEIFGVVGNVLEDAEGNVYVVDTQLSEIKMFSPAGTYVRTIGREGDGPGEFREPNGVFLDAEGRLCVLAGAPARIVRFTREGKPAGEERLAGQGEDASPAAFDAARGGPTVVLQNFYQVFREGGFDQVMRLERLETDGKLSTRYFQNVVPIDMSKIVVNETFRDLQGRWDVGPDGRVYIAETHADYVIRVCNPDGSIDRVITRAYAHRKRSREEFQYVLDVQRTLNRFPGIHFEIDENDRDLIAIWARPDGGCWVLTSRGCYDRPPGTLGVFDVFDGEGRFVREVTLAGTGDPVQDLYVFAGDRLYVVTDVLDGILALHGDAEGTAKTETAEPMSVIRYWMADGDR